MDVGDLAAAAVKADKGVGWIPPGPGPSGFGGRPRCGKLACRPPRHPEPVDG